MGGASFWSNFWEVLAIAGSVLFVAFFFGMCIFVHELGHFLVARWRGLHVDAFSIGFKKIWSKKIGGIEYRIGCLPLGGYVELPQIDSATDTPKSADGKELPHAKPLDRLLTAAAGPICNILFGFLLGCIVWWVGIPQDTPKMREIEVASVKEGSPEYAAGLRDGDRIKKINGKSFHSSWKDVVAEILTTIGEVDLEVQRGSETFHVTYLPAVNTDVMQIEKTTYPFFMPRVPIELHPEKDSIAAKAGIQSGDLLLSINGMRCDDFVMAQSYVNYYGDRPLDLEMRRAETGEVYHAQVTPEIMPEAQGIPPAYYVGVRFSKDSLVVQSLMNDFPAMRAGVLPGDKIVSFNGAKIETFPEFQKCVAENGEKNAELEVERNGEILNFTLTPKAVYPRNIGVSFASIDHPTPWQQFYSLLELTAKSIRSMAVRLGNNLGLTQQQSNISARNMSGPVGMATVLYKSVRISFSMGIYFVVMISFALAVFNLLPLPVLDGGHVFLAVIELIFRRPVPVKVVRALSYAFVGLLIALMIYITCIDALRVMPTKYSKKIMDKTEQVTPPASGKSGETIA